MKRVIKLQYNSPVILSFAFISLAVLFAGKLTGGRSNTLFFSVYNSSLTDLFTYPRFFLHVLGHSNFSHYIANMMMILLIGPTLEEKYGSRNLLVAIIVTAFVSGLIHWLFFPKTALLGASGIVFMMIVMLSLSDMKSGCIPISLILVLALYIGKEVIDGITVRDNISQLTHIIGGICGAVLGMQMR